MKASKTTLRRAVTTLVAGAALVVPMVVAIPSATADPAGTTTVCATGCDHTTIQAAVTAAIGAVGTADAISTISVKAGTYTAGGATAGTITIPAALSGLTIEGPTTGTPATVNVVGASSTSDTNVNGFLVLADDVTIQNMTITGPSTGTSYMDYPWDTASDTRYSVGIAIRKGVAGFTINHNEISGIRTGILVDGRNPGATDTTNQIVDNTIDNTKGAVLVQYTEAGLKDEYGFSIDISGNKSLATGNEWGLITHLNGYYDTSKPDDPPADPIADTDAPTDIQSALLDSSHANNGWTVQDLGYTRANRTAVTVGPGVPASPDAALHASDSNQGSPRSQLATVQAGVNAVVAGGTVNVAAGTYTGSVTVDKSVTIQGAGSGDDPASATIVSASSSSDDGITVTSGAAGGSVTVKDLRVTGSANGIQADTNSSTSTAVTLDNVTSEGNAAGLELHNGGTYNVTITSSSLSDNTGSGVKVATTASVDGFDVTGSHFDGNLYGIYVAADKTTPGTFTDVDVSGSTFNDNPGKGLYIEKMSDATFDDITVTNSGTSDATNGSGFNINLKYGTYSGITVENSTIDGSDGASASGFRIEARDDGSYASPNAASLSDVTLSDNTVTGNVVGLMFGEPGKGNAGPSGVVLTKNTITDNTTGVVNNEDGAIDVSGNYWGSADPDIDSMIDNAGSGSVTYKSFYTDAAKSTMTLLVGAVSGFASPGYASIQDAVTAAGAGDTIEVGAGNYAGTEVSLNKDGLVLKGAQAGVDARGRTGAETTITGGRLDIGADDVTIDGFTLDAATAGGNPSAAIYGSGHQGTQILNNVIENSKMGAQFDNSGGDGSDAALVQHNVFKDNDVDTAGGGGTGVFMLGPATGSPNVSILDNSFTGHPNTAINVVGHHVTIKGNTSTGDATLAVVTDSSDVTISGNTETGGTNGSGIFLGLGNSGVTVTGNSLNSAASPSDSTSAIRVSNAFGGGSAATPSTSYTITKNVVTGGWSYGLRASAAAYSGTLSLRGNQFSAPVENDDPSTTIDATGNWWSGSTRSSVSGKVSTNPWCVDSGCTTLSNATPPANKPPTAKSQSVTTAQNTSVSITLSGSDPDGDPLTFGHGSAGHGAVTGSGASLTYTPAKDYSGPDAFSFTVSDGKGGTATGLVSITVAPAVVKAPTAQSMSVATVANTAVSVTLSASDPNGQTLTYSHSGASHGTVSGSGSVVTYTPATDYSGSDSFSFTVTNTSNKTATATVSVTVAAAPLSPPVTATVTAGGKASWTPPTSGGTGTPASPPAVVPSVTSPVAGTVTFTPITTPADIGAGSGTGSGSGSGSGSGTASTYTLLTQSFIISAPAATAEDPLALDFAIDTSTLPVGTDTANLTVFRNGIAVPECTDPAAKIAAPDPCVNEQSSASGQASITVLSSHASTWTFGTKATTSVSRVKVAGVKGVSPGGTEKIGVRVWNDDDTFAASTPVTIAVTGANTANGVVTTNAKGFATFTYTPAKRGTDTVTATAGTVTGTTTVHIVRPAQRPVLGAISRHAGSVNVAVQTHPDVARRKVKIYAVHKVRGQKATLVYVGYGLTDARGRAHAVIALPSGSSYVLKARMAGRDYVEHLTGRATGTVK